MLENSTIGSSVIMVTAKDKDQPGTPNSQVRYTFNGGNNGNGSFYIEQAGGRSTEILPVHPRCLLSYSHFNSTLTFCAPPYYIGRML